LFWPNKEQHNNITLIAFHLSFCVRLLHFLSLFDQSFTHSIHGMSSFFSDKSISWKRKPYHEFFLFFSSFIYTQVNSVSCLNLSGSELFFVNFLEHLTWSKPHVYPSNPPNRICRDRRSKTDGNGSKYSNRRFTRLRILSSNFDRARLLSTPSIYACLVEWWDWKVMHSYHDFMKLQIVAIPKITATFKNYVEPP